MNHFSRLLLAFTNSTVVPVRFRTRLLILLGAKLSGSTIVHAGARLGGVNLSTGTGVFINQGFYFDGNSGLVIEDRVAIGPFVRVITAGHETDDSSRRCSPAAITAPVRIERGSWIGASVTILPGVTVGRGCVIAAGAVVHRSTAPDGLYAGVPARRVKSLPA